MGSETYSKKKGSSEKIEKAFAPITPEICYIFEPAKKDNLCGTYPVECSGGGFLYFAKNGVVVMVVHCEDTKYYSTGTYSLQNDRCIIHMSQDYKFDEDASTEVIRESGEGRDWDLSKGKLVPSKKRTFELKTIECSNSSDDSWGYPWEYQINEGNKWFVCTSKNTYTDVSDLELDEIPAIKKLIEQ
ncbi:hypothetical protein FACS1894199_18300 [Bacteroidia bacterium]|nr:hypothetical protein FACS1894199_18300 [Bacteroidia bacterium]